MIARIASVAFLLTSSFAAPQPEQTVPPFPEVHVDQRCRIFTQDRPRDDAHFSKPRFRADPDTCRIKAKLESSHWEQTVEDGVVRRTKVQIHEQMYILTNRTEMPVVFVVDQSLPAGWRIDSTPQPVEIAESMATFKVIAAPGQTIKLHVGERH